MSVEPSSSTRRPRLSLLSLLLLMTVVALGLGMSLVYRDNRRLALDNAHLRFDNNKLRYEAAGLRVEDPTKIYARQVTEHENRDGAGQTFRFEWLVHLPEDRDYGIGYGSGLVTPEGELKGGYSVYNTSSGVLRVILDFWREANVAGNGLEWRHALSIVNQGGFKRHGELPNGQVAWIDNHVASMGTLRTGGSIEGVVAPHSFTDKSLATPAHPAGDRLTLLCFRSAVPVPPAVAPLAIAGDRPGFVIWVEPANE